MVNFIAHAGHHHAASSTLQSVFNWLGKFHLLFLHFPIVFIIMAACFEIMQPFYRKHFLTDASRLMLYCAALFSIPTVLTGLSFSYGIKYDEQYYIFIWHKILGFALLGVTVLALLFRKYNFKKSYYSSLTFLVVIVFVTGYLGGILTFGRNYF
jgi:uncharacterized membrane protein